MNSWDFRGTLNYNDVFAEDHIINLFGGMEVNSMNRTKTWFNGVGMQYEMGMLLLMTISTLSRAMKRTQIIIL